MTLCVQQPGMTTEDRHLGRLGVDRGGCNVQGPGVEGGCGEDVEVDVPQSFDGGGIEVLIAAESVREEACKDDAALECRSVMLELAQVSGQARVVLANTFGVHKRKVLQVIRWFVGAGHTEANIVRELLVHALCHGGSDLLHRL